jgi:inner membrane protein
MASIGHVAVGLAGARWLRSAEASRSGSASSSGNGSASLQASVFWSALSLFPDIDVVGFLRGVPYGAAWGHRGATHSLSFALIGGIVTGLGARALEARGSGLGARGSGLGARDSKSPIRVTLLATLVLASHGLLDTLTDGGLGAALLWPFSNARFFAPWRPIPVAPIGPAFFTPEGAMVALSEVALFLPLWLFAFRARVRPATIAVWLVLVWLIGSTDPVRERVMGFILRDDTHFAAGYSEAAFRAIAIGDGEDAVRSRLGEPLFESIFYMPKGVSVQSMMEVSAAHLPPGCFGAGVKEGVVHDTHDPAICRSRGVVEGMSTADMLRILGPPTESCAEYGNSRNNGHARLRMVCFLNGKVETVFRRWI